MYKMLGSEHISFANADDPEIRFSPGRKIFYDAFLNTKSNKQALQTFLDRTKPSTAFPDLTAARLLDILDPSMDLKTLNGAVHDLTLHDVFIALGDIKELEPIEADVWINIALRVTGKDTWLD